MATTDKSAERRKQALELHLAGATYETIARNVGYASRSGAHKAVQEALAELGAPPEIGEAAEVELARLDAMLTGLWPKARRGDVQAVDRVLRISERRDALLAKVAAAKQHAAPSGPAGKVTALDEVRKRHESRGSTPASRAASRRRK